MIAIVGVSGFLGRAICSLLDAEGERTRLISRKFDYPFLENLRHAQHFRTDLESSAGFGPCLEGVDSVVFLVNAMRPNTPIEAFPDLLAAEVAQQCRFLRSCGRLGIRRVVFASSGGTVYGPTDSLQIPESAPANPISTYGASKLVLETYLRLLSREYGTEVKALRIANAYGPGQPVDKDQGVIAGLLHSAKTGNPFTIYGDGSVVRDFIHVSDIAEAVRSGIHCPGAGYAIYNIGSGQGCSINEITETVKQVSGRNFAVQYIAGRGGDVPSNVLDSKLFNSACGWTPQVGLAEGIADTWKWFNETGSGVEGTP